MKGRSSKSKMGQGNAFTTLTPTKKMEASALDLTSKEKDCKPYWSDLCAELSSRLLLPVETSKVDSDLNFSSLWLIKTVEKSWFSQILFTAQNPNSQPIFLPSFAIKDACAAVKKAKADFKKTGKICSCKFRSRKDTKQSLYIPKSAIGTKGIYHTKLGQSKLKEALPKDFSDGRLTLSYGEYYIVVSEEVQPRQTDNQGRVVGLDPGVRTFMTFFSESSYGWLVSKSRRKIRSKTVRQMLTLSHYQFKKHLEWKAWEYGKVALTSINEAYTSKTVSWTGEVKNIGGSRTIKDSDGNQVNRDLNGARGIFLRALVDTPWLKSFLAV